MWARGLIPQRTDELEARRDSNHGIFLSMVEEVVGPHLYWARVDFDVRSSAKVALVPSTDSEGVGHLVRAHCLGPVPGGTLLADHDEENVLRDQPHLGSVAGSSALSVFDTGADGTSDRDAVELEGVAGACIELAPGRGGQRESADADPGPLKGPVEGHIEDSLVLRSLCEHGLVLGRPLGRLGRGGRGEDEEDGDEGEDDIARTSHFCSPLAGDSRPFPVFSVVNLRL